MTVLQGPADADQWRVKVGRYGDRWYRDIDTGSTHPSVSTTKPPFANKYVPMKTIAGMTTAEWERLTALPVVDRYEAIKAADKRAGRINMARGTLVHQWAEDLIAGRPIDDSGLGVEPDVLAQALRFRPALEQFFAVHQPEPIAVEVVCMHTTLNGVGYGGTADLFARIEGDVWAVDWKSRTSDHGCYLEEAAQGGAYVGAEYMIVADGDQAKKAPVPDVAGVLIVSITDDSFRAYPIERQGAVDAYHAMHAWWVAQRNVTENKVIGQPWAPKIAAGGDAPSDGTTATLSPPAARVPKYDTRRDQLRARFLDMQRSDREKFIAMAVDPDDLDAVEAALDSIDPFANVTEPAPHVTVEPQPVARLDEGGDADPAAVESLRAAWRLLQLDQVAWVRSVVERTGNLSVQQKPSERRVVIGDALVRLAAAGWHDDDLLAAFNVDLATVGLVDAVCFAVEVDELIAGHLTFAVPDGGDAMQLIRAA